jgi:hypothetical protein
MKYVFQLDGHCTNSSRENIVGVTCKVNVELKTTQLNAATYKKSVIRNNLPVVINLTGVDLESGIVSSNECKALYDFDTEIIQISCSTVISVDTDGRTTISASFEIDLQFLGKSDNRRVFEVYPFVIIECSSTNISSCTVRGFNHRTIMRKSIADTCILFDTVTLHEGIELLCCSRKMIPDENPIAVIKYYGYNCNTQPWRYQVVVDGLTQEGNEADRWESTFDEEVCRKYGLGTCPYADADCRHIHRGKAGSMLKLTDATPPTTHIQSSQRAIRKASKLE